MNNARKNRQKGFTLLELIIVMVIFTFVIAAASSMFVSVLSEFKSQSSALASNIEGIVGLEMMRRDIINAGYGLFQDSSGGATYNEVEDPGEVVAASLNDSPAGIPRAIVIADDVGWNRTDRLAIKAVNVTLSDRTEKSVNLKADNTTNNSTLPADDRIRDTEQVIVMSLDVEEGVAQKNLVALQTGGFSTSFSNIANFGLSRSPSSIVFVVDPSTPLKMPFNRADYFVSLPIGSARLPGHCAIGTGVLFKAVVDHGSTGFLNPPLSVLDCVADMQIAVESDDDGDGTADDLHQGTDIAASGWNAKQVCNIRRVLVFILVQEGQRDRTYTYPHDTVRVGSPLSGTIAVGRDFDFTTSGISDWQQYRWKLYTLVVKPVNFR